MVRGPREKMRKVIEEKTKKERDKLRERDKQLEEKEKKLAEEKKGLEAKQREMDEKVEALQTKKDEAEVYLKSIQEEADETFTNAKAESKKVITKALEETEELKTEAKVRADAVLKDANDKAEEELEEARGAAVFAKDKAEEVLDGAKEAAKIILEEAEKKAEKEKEELLEKEKKELETARADLDTKEAELEDERLAIENRKQEVEDYEKEMKDKATSVPGKLISWRYRGGVTNAMNIYMGGQSGVGKTVKTNQMLNLSFDPRYIPTQGVEEFPVVFFEENDAEIIEWYLARLIDTPGDPRMRSLFIDEINQFLPDIRIAVFIFDIGNSPEEYSARTKNIEKLLSGWLTDIGIMKNLEAILVIFNKWDLYTGPPYSRVHPILKDLKDKTELNNAVEKLFKDAYDSPLTDIRDSWKRVMEQRCVREWRESNKGGAPPDTVKDEIRDRVKEHIGHFFKVIWDSSLYGSITVELRKLMLQLPHEKLPGKMAVVWDHIRKRNRKREEVESRIGVSFSSREIKMDFEKKESSVPEEVLVEEEAEPEEELVEDDIEIEELDDAGSSRDSGTEKRKKVKLVKRSNIRKVPKK